MKKILITGASGFLGSFFVEEALNRNLEVHAGVRKTSRRTYLQDSRINFFENNFADIDGMAERLSAENFDFIIHNAGIVGASQKEDYFRVNFEFTKNFVKSIRQADLKLKKFVYTSSIAASGPASAENLDEILTIEMPEKPITTYGESKLKSEDFLKKQTDFPWIIIRPTAVYGPREKDIFSFFQIINRNLETYIGFKKQHLTFIHAKDLARLFIDAAISEISQKAYYAADGEVYSSQDLGGLTKQILGKKTLKIRVPVTLAKIAAAITEMGGKFAGRFPTFNLEKVAELSAMNWKCDISPAQKDFNFKPEYDLEKGLENTLNWYKKHNWL